MRPVDALERVRVRRYLSLDDAAAFHGHKGPFLVLGYRIGRLAVEILKPESEFDMRTEVYVPLRTPFSCILDGIQCATKCTLGKFNISWRASNTIAVIFRKGQTEVIVRVREDAVRRMLSEDIERACEYAERAPLEELVEVEVRRPQRGA